MHKNKARLWNAVRSLRGKKDKMPDCSQDNFYLAKDEDVEESELETRVKRWQSESLPPNGTTSSPAKLKAGQSEDHYFEANQQVIGTMHDVEQADDEVLFHPDFADWASIHPTLGDRTPSPAEAGPDGLLQVLNDATESLSKLLNAPFG
mmetsp:Transcript_25917/g.53877  ORF Transcript_25917/g.53877 Transcript_25917/m.53877 type:complete len:149 (-) Transcript_25917:99-545(-)|eukprot:CAMPEP_0172179896 /NCGR_PEP_ID=MMETSP1050-20130122/16888_1 /TAXON_ID=233186 /ORGANISM="Cryptomonas curvata, Strain CCAP979/52" /LENGTH=148 /DNA_ID=CAMNT_0012852861 /DNA_START=207 /DNA_END=653 /DNA_ORIENTATION=-